MCTQYTTDKPLNFPTTLFSSAAGIWCNVHILQYVYIYNIYYRKIFKPKAIIKYIVQEENEKFCHHNATTPKGAFEFWSVLLGNIIYIYGMHYVYRVTKICIYGKCWMQCIYTDIVITRIKG